MHRFVTFDLVPAGKPMRDNFGRTIDYLRLSVTDRCNLRCRYCMPEEGVASIGHGEILSYEELLRVAAATLRLGVRKIRVTGGEPLVRRGIVDFVGNLAALSPRPEITLTTNGLRLAELAAPLKEAGLSRVNVSLDTLREDRFSRITRRPGLAQVLAGLDAAAAVGLSPLKINMVPIYGVNDDEIGDFARLALTRGWQVRFIEFMPVGGDLDFSPDDRVPAAVILQKLAEVGTPEPVARRGPAGPAQLYRLGANEGMVGIIPAVSGHFCGDCNRLRITADGRIRPCLLSAEEIDLRSLLRRGADEAQLETFLRNAVGAKPERHRLAEGNPDKDGRLMHGIGG